MTRAARLIAVGNVVVDITLRVPQLPETGSDVLADHGHARPGGVLNVMAAARRQGVAGIYAGLHGRGPFGDLVRSALHDLGIDVLHRPCEDADTGFTVAITDDSGERTFLTHFAVERWLDAESMARVEPRAGDVVYVSGYPLALPGPAKAVADWLFRLANEVTVIADPGPLAAELRTAELDAVLRRADWWSCNVDEAAKLTGVADPLAAASALLRRTGRDGVIVRAGADGAALAQAGDATPALVPAPAVRVIDTNGAGDTHVGVFVAALMRGMLPPEAVRRANAAAAIAVTRPGPGIAPSAEEIDRFR